VRTRVRVIALYEAGFRPAEIARRLGVSKATVSYHLRREGIKPDQRFARRFDWEAIQKYYDEGHSMRECAKHFGFHTGSWWKAVERGAIVPRPHRRPIEFYLVRGRARTSRSHLKRRLIEEGYKEERCEECELTEWRGRPIPLALHHINGDKLDNRLENLQILCANCHAQTENFGTRNWRQRRLRRALERGQLVPLRVVGAHAARFSVNGRVSALNY
jgi:transposase